MATQTGKHTQGSGINIGTKAVDAADHSSEFDVKLVQEAPAIMAPAWTQAKQSPLASQPSGKYDDERRQQTNDKKPVNSSVGSVPRFLTNDHIDIESSGLKVPDGKLERLTEANGQAWSDDAESTRRLELANEPYSERDGSLVQLAQANTATDEPADINAKMNPGHRSIEQYAQAAVLRDNPAADAALKAGPSDEAAPSSLFSDWNTILFLGFGGFILSQAAGSDEPSQGVSKSRDVSGTAINGYLDGATVFIDINNNGQADAGEPSAKTDKDGKFSLTVPEGVEGNLVVMGGTNTSTGQAFKGMMKAPPGSTVVTPLTTLVAELVKPGVSVQQAEQKVVAALGLSSGSKLINMDPIKEAAVDSATFKAHQTVAMLANDVTSKLLNATGNTNKASEFGDDIASAVFKQIAKQIESAPPASPKILDASSISNTAGALIEGLANEKALGAVSLSQAMASKVIAAKAAVQVSITEAASALQKAPTKLEPSALKTLVDEQAKLQASTLVNGVASGEATQNSAVLWARSLAIGELSFELGTTADFSGDLKSVKVEVIDPSIPVKAPISGLKASTEYFYRVKDAGGDIKTGRFTTPADLGVAKGLTFGASGDWRGELSPFPAVSNADEKRLDFFVLLGDTIYADYPSPDLNKPQAESLADFRAKHGEVYRSKAGLNALGDLRGSTAVWATIDDHEVTNDFAGGAPASSDSRFNAGNAGLINDTALYENGLTAFQEFNPIAPKTYTSASTPNPLFDGEAKLYRYQNYGSDAAVMVLDARSFRSEPLDSPNVTNQAKVIQFLGQAFTPARSLLGKQQLDELKKDLVDAQDKGIVWKFVFLSQPIQNFGPLAASDRYEGYAAERAELLAFIESNNIKNVVFVAADFHGTVVNNLSYQSAPGGQQISTGAWEITTGSVAFDKPFGPTVVGIAQGAGLVSADQAAYYASLPGDAKNVFVKGLINGQLAPFGYDPVGLNNNLPGANGRIDAKLLKGDYVATETYGWTEFKIDAATRELTVTTWGVDAYGANQATLQSTISQTPRVVSEFAVKPQDAESYRLQLLHFADAEAGMLASQTAPKLAALIDRFEDQYVNSITLAGGDNFIPGPFLAAGTDDGVRTVFNSVTGSTVTGTMPIAGVDIALHNLMGVQASAVGNHEFDLGSNVLVGAFGGGSGFGGAQFPYISANLDVGADSALKARYTDTLATAGLEEAASLKGRLVPSAVITEGGAKIGLLGATTQLLESISSPSGTKVKDNDSVRSDDMDLLAAQLQPVIDDLIAQGVNKIILMAHLQVLANEKLLASKLSGVDIILAAGSNTRLGDATDTAVAFPGHAANFADTYPLVIKDKDSKNTLVVNTDNEFTYLGRLVVDFDASGNIVIDSLTANAAVNGAYAATDANVATAWGTSAGQLAATAYATGTRGGQVKALTDAVQSVITAKDGNVYGYADVYLEGERIAVRNQETNLGNLSADANGYALEQALGSAAAQTYIVSLKNGGGIRAQIGTISPPKADGSVDKLPPEGGVSQLDVENSLRFNNQLMAFDTTPAGLKAILEHGVASLGSQGRFPQLGGVSFSYDPDLPAGSRVGDIALVGEDYRVALYNDGVPVSGAPDKITVVTLSFLANGGDSYPIKINGENFRYLVEQPGGSLALTTPVDESKNFTEAATVNAAVGTSTLLGEQKAFEVYMKAFHATPQTAFDQADTPEALDERIQNLNVRSESVLEASQFAMNKIGTFSTNVYNASGAEIVAYDAGSKRMFLVNAVAAEIQVIDLKDPSTPALLGKLDFKGYATTSGTTPQVNSVAVSNGLVAVALADASPTASGKVILFKADVGVSLTAAAPAGARALDAGVGPDMVTFSPDGKKVLVANEAESINERAATDPYYNGGVPFVANGGITVVTLGSEASSAIANATVQQLDFSAYNGKEGLLRERGVRIAAGTTAANDLEPEYIAVSPDGKQAMVTLQENNAVAVLNLSGATASIVDIVALGYKNHARGDLLMTAYDTLSPTELGTIGTDAFGKAVPAGGFSGLHYTGEVNGKMRFLAVSDRGPNGEPVNVDGDAALERPFVLPDYQARVSTLEFDPASKQLSIVSTTMLTRADGKPLTGLPNIPGVDEEPVQIVPASDTSKAGTFTSGGITLGYKTLAYDTLGADLEGIYQTSNGNMWMVDEYRPAVYEFDAAGKMVSRFVPVDTAALTADITDNFGIETLPAHLIKRQANRGFEALAVDEAKGLLFAFVQSPLDSVTGSTADTSGPLIRIEVMAMRDLAAGLALPQGGTLAAAVRKGEVIAEYAYLLDRPSLRVNSQIDKIGDAAFNPATGTIFVFERDNEVVPEGKKMLFEIDLRGATNLLTATPTLPAGKTALEALTVDELLAAGVNPVYKEMLANLPSLGFLPNDKAEGLALLPNGGLAVINDNDFGVNGAGTETVGFGVLNFNGANRIDADNDTTGQPSGTIPGINIVKAGLYGAYMPDAIASFSANGKTYYITANEGDSRGIDEVQIKDLGTTGKPAADDSAGARLLDGDLKVITNGIDVDGDGDLDKLVAFGGRSFSILDAYGNRIYDSGDQLERLIAEVLPNNFNANHSSNSLDNRSDDKGPEPEGVTTAMIGDKVLAFVGLERVGGVAIFDVSDPYSPSFVSYSNTRNFGQSPGQDATTKAISGGDLGPEGLVSVAAANSPTGLPMVMVANEVSGTVGLFNVVPMSSSENDPYLWLGSNLSNASLAPGSLFIA